MIKLNYVPNLLDEGGRLYKEVPYVEKESLYYYIKEAMFLRPEFKVIVNGKNVVAEDLKDVIVEPDSEVIIYVDIEGPEVWFAIGYAIGWLAAFVVEYWFYILTIGYMIYNYMNQPSKPNFGAIGDGIEEGSPTYGWDGIRTTQDIEMPVPIVYGEMMVGGNVINQYVSSSGDQNTLNTLLALCEGEIESIGDVLINDNPSDNFDGITFFRRYGTNDQDIIPGFEDIHDVYDVSATLTKDNPAEYTTINSDVEAFEIYLNVPSGLFQVDPGSGKLLSWAITYRVEYKLTTEPTWTDLGLFTINEKTQSVLRRIHRVDGLTSGRYDIRVTRTSDDPTLDPQKLGTLDWASVDEIATDDIAYVNTACLGIKALATNQLSGSTPNYNVVVKGRKVLIPDVRLVTEVVDWEDWYYDSESELFRLMSDDTPLTWDGVTYRAGYSGNPIWCMQDLLTSTRYGLGQYIDTSNLHGDHMLLLALHCETRVPNGRGGYMKRYRFDLVLDSKTRAFDVITQLCTTFNAYPMYVGGKIAFEIDRVKDYSQHFGMGNIKKGSFRQTWKSTRELYNIVEVTFNNKDNYYKKETIAYDGEGELRTTGQPDNVLSITLFTTDIAYAIRQARFAWLIAKYVDRGASFTTSFNAIGVSPQEVIAVSHDIPQWGESGSVMVDSTASIIKLDRDVVVETSKTYKLLIQFQNGTIEESTVVNTPGTYDSITVSPALSATPQLGDSFSFGESNLLFKKYKVTDLVRKSDQEIEVNCIEYYDELYDDSDVTLPENNLTTLERGVPNCSDVVLTEDVGVNNNGVSFPSIIVSFQKPVITDYYLNAYEGANIYISDNGGESYIYAGSTVDSDFTITRDLLVGHEYAVKVVSYGNGMVNPLSSSPYGSITLNGIADAPAEVQNFTETFDERCVLKWDLNTELNVAGYEIRDEDANFGVDNTNLIFRGLANIHQFTPATRNPGTYYIRCFNSSGIYSETSASVTPVNEAPGAPTDFTVTVYFNYGKLAWTNPTDSDIKKYQIYKSKTNAWAGEEILDSETTGRDAIVEGRAPRSGMVDSAGSDTIVDASLVGFDDGYFVGDTVELVNGTGSGQTKTITAFDGDTGTITVDSAWSPTPDETTEYFIFNTCYYKVRAYDTYGEGTFTSALVVTYTGITEDMLGDDIVTARKIYVGQLSAISADMGSITAGTVTGATIQTANSGARTVMDAYSIKSYDACCVKQLEICNGNIWARSIKLEDPDNAENYSYLDGGALKFHDALGNVPYVKRLCSGVSCNGCTIELCGWTFQPEIQVSPKSISTYRKDYSGVNQVLCVYYDNLQSFCTACDCYGYCFDVYAKILQESGLAPETIKDVNFGVCTTTNDTTCWTCVRNKYQLWCNASAPSNYYYGCLYYNVCYRVYGDSVWCSCTYTYEQCHSNEGALKTTYDAYVELQFPCAACWEIMSCQTCLTWHDSGICATTSCTALCSRTVTANCLQGIAISHSSVCNCFDNISSCFAWVGSNPTNVYHAHVCICAYSVSPDITTCLSNACSSNFACASVYFDTGGYTFLYPQSATQGQACLETCTFSGYQCIDVPAGCSYDYVCMTNYARVDLKVGSGYARSCSCFVCATLYQCYCIYSGAAASCCYERLYSLCDCTDYSISLDPSGLINWLAVSYS